MKTIKKLDKRKYMKEFSELVDKEGEYNFRIFLLEKHEEKINEIIERQDEIIKHLMFGDKI